MQSFWLKIEQKVMTKLKYFQPKKLRYLYPSNVSFCIFYLYFILLKRKRNKRIYYKNINPSPLGKRKE